MAVLPTSCGSTRVDAKPAAAWSHPAVRTEGSRGPCVERASTFLPPDSGLLQVELTPDGEGNELLLEAGAPRWRCIRMRSTVIDVTAVSPKHETSARQMARDHCVRPNSRAAD